MEITEEQRERIRKNRERALEIQRKRRKEREDKEKQEKEKNAKKQKTDLTNTATTTTTAKTATSTDDDGPLEEFEVGASEWVTKKEAKSTYCLPDGTLAVCECQERENPHHKGWKPMKLYRRSEIRQRAHKRFDGMEGLIEERKKRQAKQLAKDMKAADKIFE